MIRSVMEIIIYWLKLISGNYRHTYCQNYQEVSPLNIESVSCQIIVCLLLPGKYIVCGETMSPNEGDVTQASCFEANIEKDFENGEEVACFLFHIVFS